MTPKVRLSSRFLNTSATRFRSISVAWARVHAALNARTGGRFVPRWFGAPVLIIETVGRKTGARRRTPLVYARRGPAWVVVAANAGASTTPAWWLNLSAAGEGTVIVGGQAHRVRPRVADGSERAELWTLVATAYPGVDDYLSMTSRPLPVVVLDPVGPRA